MPPRKKSQSAPPADSETTKRADGWTSSLLGFGTSRDRMKSFSFSANYRPSDPELEELYTSNPIAAKIVDTLADDATREAIEIKGDQEQADWYYQELDRLNANRAFNQAIKWARLYGGAAILIDIEGQDPSEPVDLSSSARVARLVVIEKSDLSVEYVEKYKPVEYYLFGGVRIHASRLLVLTGPIATETARQKNAGFGDSELFRAWDALLNYDMVHNSCANIATRFAVGNYKLAGLNQMLLQGDDAAVIRKLTAIEDGISILNSRAMDAEDDFNTETVSVSGIDQLLMAAERRVCAAANMPHTLVFGESPGASLGEAGKSQKHDWYDRVKAYQETQLRGHWSRLLDLIAAQENEDRPEFEFCSLWQMSELEEVEIRERQAKVDQIYLTFGVVAPNEIRDSRYTPGGYSTETILSEDWETPESEEDAEDQTDT